MTEQWLCEAARPTVARASAIRLRVFCYPHAGGAATRFAGWRSELPDDIQLYGVQLPGRGRRLREPVIDEWRVLVPLVGEALRPKLDRPFLFFGHSVGAALAFEVSRWLRRQYGLMPVHLFVSGRRAPRTPSSSTRRHTLPDAEFLAALAELGGMPLEVLREPDLLPLVLPALRADVRLSELHSYVPDRPLSCPISVLCGSEDPETSGEAAARWREETIASCAIHTFPGGHFFIDPHKAEVVARIREVADSIRVQPDTAQVQRD